MTFITNMSNSNTVPPSVVSFGMIVPASLLTVEEFPVLNTGVNFENIAEFISDDAAIVSTLLREWDISAGLIGTTLGNDSRGLRTIAHLEELGVQGHHRVSSELHTPHEFIISDRTGNRTYFWRREAEILATLDSADLSMIRTAKLLYVDWYDESHILRPMEEARTARIPIFLNLEHGHQNRNLVELYAPYATICQAVTDAAQLQNDGFEVARRITNNGISTALVTMGKAGCVAMTQSESVHVAAPIVNVIDSCGAGATFSAGFIYGHLQDWNLEDKVKFAVAAASLKCEVIGPRAFPVDQVWQLASGLDSIYRHLG